MVPSTVALFGWGPNDWSAFGNVLLGIGALAAGAWALFNYQLARRATAASWLQGVFRDFYLSDRFVGIRATLEYDYVSDAGPLLERRVTDRDVPLTDSDRDLLFELDTLLNYFEHVLYLENEGQLRTLDRQAVFEYWFDVMCEPERGGLRLYVQRFGFERVADVLKADGPQHVAVYGTLMEGLGLDDLPDLGEALVAKGPCTIAGRLHDIGEYPGLVAGEGRVRGELFELREGTEVLKALDRYEQYDPFHRADSLYVRRCVRLLEPAVDAWVYFYAREVNDEPIVPGGDWRSWRDARERPAS